MKSPCAGDVLIVALHSGLREACRAVVELLPQLHVCGEAAGHAEALRLLKAVHPDLVLVVLSFQYAPDLQFMRAVKTLNRSTKILVFAIRDVHDECITARRCREAGADLYVRNTGEAWRLAEALESLAGGQPQKDCETMGMSGQPLHATEPHDGLCAHTV